MRILLLLLFILPALAFGQDVRNCKWGMSRDEVKKAEKGVANKTLTNANQLAYSVTLDHYNFLIAYQFENDKLYRATLVYNNTHYNAEVYYQNFLKIASKLDGKYSDHEDQTSWNSDLYKDDKDRWGFAASNSHVVFRYQWLTDNTEIKLVLLGEDFKSNLGLVYSDRTHVEKESNKTDF